MTWKSPVVLTKPMLSIKKEIARFNSLVSTFAGKVKGLELKAPVCRKMKTIRKSLHTSPAAHQAGAHPVFCSMKRLGVFLLPLDGMLVHRRVTPALDSPAPIYKPGCREAL